MPRRGAPSRLYVANVRNKSECGNDNLRNLCNPLCEVMLAIVCHAMKNLDKLSIENGGLSMENGVLRAENGRWA